MTDNEIIKALEWHLNDETHCSACPYEEHSITHYCVDMVMEDTLDLINRQKAEIERKEKELEAFARWDKEYQTEIYELKKSLLSKENLEESFSKSVKQFDKKLARTVKLERAEAIKEFAERLKETSFYVGSDFDWLVEQKDIDNLAKEMVGEG